MILQEAIHEGSLRMAEIDPHGFTLSLVAVLVVFSALIILFLIYNLSGKLFTGQLRLQPHKRKAEGSPADEQTAAAIALALHLGAGGTEDEIAAIAAALHIHLGSACHETESGIITIKHDLPSTWGDRSRNFRKQIHRK